jgi:hypothetical protein
MNFPILLPQGHMTCLIDGMHNLRTINLAIQIGTGETITCTQVGDKHVKILQQDGSSKDIELKNCKYVPGLFTNLFSNMKVLGGDWSISNNGIKIVLTKNAESITFDQVLRTDSGAFTVVEMIPRQNL